MEPANGLLRFEPFVSSVDLSFWHELCRKKLDIFRLSEEPVPIHAFFNLGSSVDSAARLALTSTAFDVTAKPPQHNYSVPGILSNFNTVEAFKILDRKALLKKLADDIWADIDSGAAERDPSRLARWSLTAFSDLKKYRFSYWFAFPAITPPSEKSFTTKSPPTPLNQYFAGQLASITESLIASREANRFAFLVKKTGETVQTADLSEWSSFWTTEPEEDRVIALATPSSSAGWPLRNLLVLLKHKLKLSAATVLQVRCDRSDVKNFSASDVIQVDLFGGEQWTREQYGVVGWERTSDSKLAPRSLNLESTMDPTKLAASAVDLNLKLMRWRLLPNLDLATIAQTKCLLMGAGTLGCNVARNLMSWGVRKITFVDNGKVSFSNPVRQWLYTFEDSKEQRPKAPTAAKRLKEIFPDMDATAHEMTIPMPGHIVKGAEAVAECKATVAKLEQLIAEHDVVFLLLDSREARWLPTVIATAQSKLVMTTALGFDNFVVMRHGLPPTDESAPLASSVDSSVPHRLGCYFCNDVVAPGDSMRDRTLDQQCTVTRPGLSGLASSLSVELLVSLLHHPLRGHAPADQKEEIGGSTSTELGILPHQLRGFLSYFTELIVTGHHYDKCVACSAPIISAYKEKGCDFLIEAFNYPQLLEDITGITQMKEEAADIDVAWDSENDDF